MNNGVLLVLFASCWFGLATMGVKALGPDLPTAWVAFLRNAIALPILLAAAHRRRLAFRSPNRGRLVLRGLFGVCAMSCLFWALPRLPLANTMLLSHASPFYAAIWGVLFMGEKLDRTAAACIAAAFVGVYAALRPTLAFDPAPAAAAAAAGLFSSLAFATIKSLSKREPPLRIVLYFAMVGTVVLMPAALRTGYLPTAGEWAGMAGVAVAATAGQMLLTIGIGRAPVSKASLGALFIIVVNVAGGRLFWGERPDGWTWVGVVLILGGIMGLALDRRPLLVTVAE